MQLKFVKYDLRMKYYLDHLDDDDDDDFVDFVDVLLFDYVLFYILFPNILKLVFQQNYVYIYKIFFHKILN